MRNNRDEYVENYLFYEINEKQKNETLQEESSPETAFPTQILAPLFVVF